MPTLIRLAAMLITLVVAMAACGSNSSNGDGGLTVSAAVSLKDAFEEIRKIYETRNSDKVTFNFGASGVLQKQIETGAPVDVFASAGQTQMDALDKEGLLVSKSRVNFDRNQIVLIVPNTSQMELNSFDQLADARVGRIAAGNPKTVPAGQYSEQILKSLGIDDKVGPKLVLAEDVRQVLEYVTRGEVDAGIVYETDARTAGAKVRVVATAPESSHQPILYPIAVIKDSKQAAGAKKFIDLVLSPEGQSVLQKYGFSSIKN
jgi:molybdate transport system substrate-binding protein